METESASPGPGGDTCPETEFDSDSLPSLDLAADTDVGDGESGHEGEGQEEPKEDEILNFYSGNFCIISAINAH